MRLVLFAIVFLAGCASVPTSVVATYEPLSWENTTEAHPERKPWSEALIKSLNENWAVFDSAKDIQTFCPKYKSLDKTGRLKAWGELWVGLAYYESGYNPKSFSKDVGSEGKFDTYSAGLFQVSAADQEWAGGNLKYTYQELLTALPNIHLSTVLMVRQLKNTQLIALPNSSKYRYWSTLLVGNRYQKISEIAQRVKKYATNCY